MSLAMNAAHDQVFPSQTVSFTRSILFLSSFSFTQKKIEKENKLLVEKFPFLWEISHI